MCPSDIRDARVKGLGCAGQAVAAPFTGRPECAGGVVGVGPFRGDKMDASCAERGGVTQDISGGLRTRQANNQSSRGQCDGRRSPGDIQSDRGGRNGGESGFAELAVDQTDVECIAFNPAENVENVQCSRIGAREGRVEFGCFEENQVHARIASICASSSEVKSRVLRAAKLSSSWVTLLAPISAVVMRGSRTVLASASWASD